MTRTLTLTYPSGLHARPSTVLAKIVLEHDAVVLLKHGDRIVHADSVIDVLSCGVLPGDVKFEAEGPDSEKVLDAIGEFFHKLNTTQTW